MRLDITGRHFEITAPLRHLIGKRLARLERVLNDAAISATAILTKEKFRLRSEIIVHTRGDHVLRGSGEAAAWPASIREATDALEQQAETLKGKWIERKRRSTAARRPRTTAQTRSAAFEAPADQAPRVVRATRYAVKPQSIEDAAERIENGPETFVVFRNAETDAISVLYRRKDGNLGLIEAE